MGRGRVVRQGQGAIAERNAFGVMDHDVTLESGVTVHNAMKTLKSLLEREVIA